MYQLLLRLIIITTVLQLGLSLSNPEKVQKASRDVLKIRWKPISVFPEEARRFK